MRFIRRKIMNFFILKNIDEYKVTYQLTAAGYIALIAVFIVLFSIGCMIAEKDKKIGVRQIAFSAMAVALAVVTSMIKIVKLPMGGSVTLFSMFFIILIGYWFGVKTGILMAVGYGILQMLIDPYIINVYQMFLDYIFAFGALGLSGIFSKVKNGLVKGYLLGVIVRFIFSFLSGWIFFAVYTPVFFNTEFLYSVAYNGAYIGLEAALTVALISCPPVKKALVYVKNMLV